VAAVNPASGVVDNPAIPWAAADNPHRKPQIFITVKLNAPTGFWWEHFLFIH
jgi:hypothetical protein